MPAGKVSLEQQTEYPWQGQVKLIVNPEKNTAFALQVRIPGWAQADIVPGELYQAANKQQQPLVMTLNGKPVKYQLVKGYAVISRTWKKGDAVAFTLPMDVQKIYAKPDVKDDKSRFALQRGPIVYCLEGPDNKDSAVQNIVVDKSAAIAAVNKPGLLNGVTVLEMKGSSTKRQLNSDQLISSDQTVTAIPYYSWANRGPSDMVVWIPYEASAAKPKPAPTIASKSKVTASIANARMYKALNDQYDPESSQDHNAPYLHWWPKKNTLEWVQYDFDQEYTVSQSKIYWFDDGPGVVAAYRHPGNCIIKRATTGFL